MCSLSYVIIDKQYNKLAWSNLIGAVYLIRITYKYSRIKISSFNPGSYYSMHLLLK